MDAAPLPLPLQREGKTIFFPQHLKKRSAIPKPEPSGAEPNADPTESTKSGRIPLIAQSLPRTRPNLSLVRPSRIRRGDPSRVDLSHLRRA